MDIRFIPNHNHLLEYYRSLPFYYDEKTLGGASNWMRIFHTSNFILNEIFSYSNYDFIYDKSFVINEAKFQGRFFAASERALEDNPFYLEDFDKQIKLDVSPLNYKAFDLMDEGGNKNKMALYYAELLLPKIKKDIESERGFYPDLIIHGGTFNFEHQILAVEIKRGDFSKVDIFKLVYYMLRLNFKLTTFVFNNENYIDLTKIIKEFDDDELAIFERLKPLLSNLLITNICSKSSVLSLREILESEPTQSPSSQL